MTSPATTHPAGSASGTPLGAASDASTSPRKAALPGGLQVLSLIGMFAAVKLFFALPIPSETFATIGGYSGQIYMGLAVLLTTWYLRQDGQTWRDLGMRWSSKPMDLLKGAGMVLLVFGAALAINGATQAILLPALGIPVERTLPDVSTLTRYLVIMALVLTTNSFGEEMVFRGFTMDRISAMFGGTKFAWILAAFAQAIIFGTGHFYQGLAGVIITTCVGVMFGLLYLVAKRNLWPMIIAHAIINSIGMTILHLQATGAIQLS